MSILPTSNCVYQYNVSQTIYAVLIIYNLLYFVELILYLIGIEQQQSNISLVSGIMRVLNQTKRPVKLKQNN